MKNWQKALVITLVTLIMGGIYLLFVFVQRHSSSAAHEANSNQSLSRDDVAEVRAIFPTSFDDVLKLQNTSVWMKNGYTMPYFPYNANHIDFSKSAGLIPSAQRLDIEKIVKNTVPADVDDGISHGAQQVFAVFAMPGSRSLYAAAIGVVDGSQEAYFTDVLFYYDDPHTIYNYWPKSIWSAIDAHQVVPGMSELETRMSIGQKIQTSHSPEGNRTVIYDQAGKQWTVTYVDNHATAIKTE